MKSRLFIYTYYDPSYRQGVTLDCTAATQDRAFDKAVRFLGRENARRHRCVGNARTIRMPRNPSEIRSAT